MKERLVNWDQAEDLGIIGEPWLSPGTPEALVDIAPISEIGAEELIVIGGARWYGARLLQYPEGYHALEIVDMETGETAPPGADMRYIGVDFRYMQTQMACFLQEKRPLYTGDGHAITGATIGATGDVKAQAEFNDRTGRMSLTINPTEESADLRSMGKLNTPYTSRATLETYSTGENSSGKLLIWGGPLNTIKLTFDSEGRVNKVTTHANKEVRALGESLLGRIGIESVNDSPVHEIEDPDTIAAISNRVAQEFLGLPEWRSLNISATAQGLYAATQDTGYFPTEALRFNTQTS